MSYHRELTKEEQEQLKELVIHNGGWWETWCEKCGDITFVKHGSVLGRNGDYSCYRHTEPLLFDNKQDCMGSIVKHIWHETIPGIPAFCKTCGNPLED